MVALPFRVGIGFDAHAFSADRPLILGGVLIPHRHGLSGHSDADVLTHVIIDALIGAANLGSIGVLFPDTDPQYKGIESIKLLEKVVNLVHQSGYVIGNVDTVIVAQAPKLMPHRQAMQNNLATALQVDLDQVSVKATTTEKLGFEGQELGISAHAVVLLVR